MTDLRKAAEMALEALLNYPLTEGRAIQALRQALAQPEQKPVCTKIEGNQFETFKVRYEDAVKLKDLPVGTKLYAALPSKPWVDLSDEEKTNIASTKNKSRHWLVWATEAALRSKNNG